MLADTSDASRALPVRRACLTVTGLVSLVSLAVLLLSAARGWGAHTVETSLALTLAALAVLVLAPEEGERGWGARRILGITLALALVALWALQLGWLNGAGLAFLAPKTGACMLFLGLSLAFKPWWPKTAAGFDLLVAFVAYIVLLDLGFAVPAANPGQRPMSWEEAAALLLLSGVWLALHPRQRPAAYFFESGSAGAVMRRTLPVVLAFPLVIVFATAAKRNGRALSTTVGTAIFEIGLVAFIVALLWMIARALDRMDAVRALAHRDLRDSEARYRLLFEGNPQPMWIHDAATLRFLAVNDSACQIYGYTRAEFLAMDTLQVCRPDEEPADVLTGLWHHRTKNGDRLEVEVFSHRILWDGREAEVAFIHDVTARRATEAQVHVLLESTTEGIIATDLDGRCVWTNPAAEHLLGYPRGAGMLGQDIVALLGGGKGRLLELKAAIQAGVAFSANEVPVPGPDGTSFPADIRSAPLRRDRGPSGTVVAFDDVSDRVQLQEQFHQAQKMEAVGRLAAGIAHDFNNLLTVINGYTDMLVRRSAERALPADVAAKLANIQKAGDRAAALTRQLLAFSRQQVLEPKLIALNDVLREMDPLLRRVLGEDLQLKTALAPDLAAVRADPSQIEQVLMNLVVNARDAMPDGGRLTIESANVELDGRYVATHPEATAGPHVMLAITDNGTGMDHATLTRVFEPFFTTKPSGKGTGLGLSTVFGIVKQSGGSVAIYSELGRGTAVKVYLPAMQGEVASATAAAGSARPIAASHRLRVLVVEDDAIVRDLVVEVLGEGGYEVMCAASPAEAIALCERDHARIDLMVTDVVMPGMDGRKLAAQLAPARPAMAVLFISGYPQQAISHNGDLEEGLAFIQKPFTPEALLRRVRQILSEPRAVGASGE